MEALIMYDNWKSAAPESEDVLEYGDDEPTEADSEIAAEKLADSEGLLDEALRLERAL